MSIFSDVGFAGRPGIVVILPVIGTKNPAPAENLISLTVILKPLGLPKYFGLSESEYWVFAIQIGNLSKPNSSQSFISCSAVTV